MAADESHDDKTQSFVALTSGTSVLHYKILEKIGSGGMGEVYLALDTKLNRKVALKFLPQHLCQDEDCRKRFAREAQAAAGLDHPNIAAIYEVGEFQDRPFYAMQIVEGQSLKDVITGKDLPIERILEIAIQVCEGLQAAHERGIIHRDIKPSNILIDGHSRVRIVDFGLAAVSGSEQLTKTGSTLGTIGYMSPEQIEGRETDARSDLFSLGVVLYELITKQNPFKRDSEAATLKAVSVDAPEPLARFKKGIPNGLQSIIDKVLEKEVKIRYQHADGLLSDLMRVKRSIESGQSIVSGKPIESLTKRNLWVAAALIAVMAAVVLFVKKPWITGTSSNDSDRIMLAVLPFENMGAAEDEYFADGMTEEITARLAAVHNLGVIARTSTMQYKHTEKSVQQIGRELGVEYILEGTVRWQKTSTTEARIRITPQLIRVSDETHVWAEVYDEVLSEIFQIQTKIASLVVDALNISLVATEEAALASVPTANLDAYDYYLQGKEYYDSYKSMDELRIAVQMFERALEIDSTFAGAHVWLTRLYLTIPDFVDPLLVDSLREIAYQHALKAQVYSANGIDGYLAMGHYYSGIYEYDQALAEFNRALAMQPNNSEIIEATAGVLDRQGRWNEALDLYESNALLNPRSVAASWDLALTYYYMRRFADANRVVEKGLSLSPDWWPYKTLRAWAVAAEYRSPDSGLVFIERMASVEDEQFIESFKMEHLYLKGDFAEVVALPITADKWWSGDSAAFYLMRGHAYDKLGEKQIAFSYYDSARTIIDYRIRRGSDLGRDFTRLGRIYALEGDTDEALKLGRTGLEAMPLSRDAIEGALTTEGMAKIYSLTGHADEAIALLDTLLRIPSHMNLVDVEHDPCWDPLRDHPRYKALIEKYDKKYDQITTNLNK